MLRGWGIVVCAVLSVAAQAQDGSARLFQWFDSLGYKAVASAPFVQIEDKQPGSKFQTVGFLLSKENGRLVILNLSLRKQSFSLTPDKTGFNRQVVYKAIDLAKWAAAINREEMREPLYDATHQLHTSLESFVLARALKARKEPDLAQKFYELSTSLTPRVKTPAFFFDSFIRGEVELAVMNEILMAFADGEPREEILTRLRVQAPRFTVEKNAAWAKDILATLETMVQEDRRHQKKPLEGLSQKDLIADLIFRLRDAQGSQMMVPGSCDVFNDPRGERAEAFQLLKIGYPAVPQLIEALDDKRLTRSVGAARFLGVTPPFLRVGDAAQQILERIASRYFYPEQSEGTWQEVRRSVRKVVEGWWSVAKDLGERQMLIKDVESGEQWAVFGVQRLMILDRSAAEKAIAKGIANTKDPYVRASLAGTIGLIQSDFARNLVRDLMLNAPDVRTRIAAAATVATFDTEAMVKAMAEIYAKKETFENDDYARREIARILVESGRVAALQAVVRDLPKTPLAGRLDLVAAFAQGQVFPQGRYGNRIQPASAEEQGEFAKQVEAFLVDELDDREAEESSMRGFQNVRFESPRPADIAAYALGQLWPQRYPSYKGPSPFRRELNRVQCLNVARQAAGQSPLSLPERPSAAILPPEQSTVVRDVQIEGEFPASWKDRLSKLQGKPLTPDAFVSTLLENLNDLPAGPFGFGLTVVRDDDRTGIAIRLNAEKRASEGSGFLYRARVLVDGEALANYSGGSSLVGHLKNPETWLGLKAALKKALASKPDQVIQAVVKVNGGEKRD